MLFSICFLSDDDFLMLIYDFSARDYISARIFFFPGIYIFGFGF